MCVSTSATSSGISSSIILLASSLLLLPLSGLQVMPLTPMIFFTTDKIISCKTPCCKKETLYLTPEELGLRKRFVNIMKDDIMLLWVQSL
jgi:hypothetical protein